MPEQLPDINLLPSYERGSHTLFRIFAGILLLTILLYGIAGYYYFSLKHELAAAEADYETFSQQADVLETTLANAGQTDDAAPFAEIADFLESQDIHTSIFIREITELLPSHGYLAAYQYSGNQAVLYTQFETLDAVAAYTDDLNQSRFTKDMKVNNVSAASQQGADHMDRFTRIPRYQSTFTMQLNKQKLKGAQDTDE